MTPIPHRTNLENIKVTAHGCRHYSELPKNYRLAKMDDFIINDKRDIGKMFLIQWIDNAFVYQICYVSNNLTRKILQPHLEDKRVFVMDENFTDEL